MFQLEIIDACVEYIEQLQHQLYLRYNPPPHQHQQLQQPLLQLEAHARGPGWAEDANSFARLTTRQQRHLVKFRQNFRLR